MVTTNREAALPPVAIDAATELGAVHLTVADLDREVTFYRDILGFQVQRRDSDTAALGAGGAELLRLTERPGAPRVTGTTGLYHYAVLVRQRVDLAQLLRRIAETRTPVQGLVDHHTHLAIYLADPEGNGIELAWDRPRDQWPTWETMYRRGNAPLDVEGLFAELPAGDAAWAGLPADTAIGHVHLHVAELKAADAFYHGLLGFDVTVVFPRSAEFVAAGGYHHHIGFNLWAGPGAPPPPAGAQGLRYFTIRLPNAAELARLEARLRAAGLTPEQTPEGLLVEDPSRNGVLLTAASRV
jgi:catechol 2,3-dioxygenase